MAIVTFEKAKNGSPMAFVSGKISFPKHKGPQPAIGETWEVEVSESNPRRTVHFLRLIRKVYKELSDEPAILVVVSRPSYYFNDVLVDGNIVLDVMGMTVQAKVVEFNLPSRATLKRNAQGTFKLTPAEAYVLMYEAYNATSRPSVVKTEGLKELFGYGDEHGKRWGALYKIDTASWLIDWNVPGNHGHGVHKCRAIGTRDFFERNDKERRVDEAAQV